MSSSCSPWSTVPGRCSSPNLETEYQSSRYHHGDKYGESSIKLMKRDHQYASLFAVVASTQGEHYPESYMKTNTDIEFERQYEIKARAPWAGPQDFIPSHGAAITPSGLSYRDSKAKAPWAEPEDFIPRARGFTPGHGFPELSPPLGRFDKFHSQKLEREIFPSPRTPPRVPSPPKLSLQERIDQLVDELKNPSTYCSDNSNSQVAPKSRVSAMRDFARFKRKLSKR
ncbi:hypothetical protein F4678DRAFT_464487 [Xylaria arbuscula]|nr:hypothetical protein F4678DRAFT_464487 [Xylaria arbuscula]